MALTPTAQATTAAYGVGNRLHAADQLQALAQLTPATLRRLERAFALVRQGAVRPGLARGTYWVRSQRTGDEYLVTVTATARGVAIDCACPDAAGGSLCKHAPAVVLHRRLGGEDAPPPVAARQALGPWPMRCDAVGVDPDAPIPYRLAA